MGKSKKDHFHQVPHCSALYTGNKREFCLVQNKVDVLRLSKKPLWITIAVLGTIFVSLLIVAAFFDYQIDKALATKYLPSSQPESIDIANGNAWNLVSCSSSSWYVHFVNSIYEIPKDLIPVLCFSILFCNCYRINNRVGAVSLGIADYCLATWYLYQFPFSHYLPNGGVYQFLGAFAALVTCTFIFILMQLMHKQTLAELLRWALIVLCAQTCCGMTKSILKQSFQRERYFYILAFSKVQAVYDHGVYLGTGTAYSDLIFGGFHPWYSLPLQTSPFHTHDITESFPSGHTTNACNGMLPLVLLPFVVRKCNKVSCKAIVFSVAPIWIIGVMIMRLVAGAHYLSDVTMAALLCTIWYCLFYVIFSCSCKWLAMVTNLWIYPQVKTK